MLKNKKNETKNEALRLPEPDEKYIFIENIKYAAYQRELNPKKVKQIVESFRPEIAGHPLISFRRGEFWCVDGQHILKALYELGYKEVKCRILTGLTYEEECLDFVVLNTGRTKLNANQIFHGRVEEKDANAIALVKAFNKYGFSYNKNSSNRQGNLIGTVTSFVSIQKDYGMSMVERVLKILRKSWFGEKGSLLMPIVNGVKTFLNEFPDCDDDILIATLEKINPDDLVSDAKDYNKRTRVTRSSVWYQVAKIIEEKYEEEVNKPRKGRKRAEVA